MSRPNHKWKMLKAAMGMTEITSRDFAGATGLPAYQTAPYAHSLETEGFLRLVREEPQERGGRPMKVYAWTGKRPNDATARIFRAEGDSMWGKDVGVVINCFNQMVRCRESNDGTMACAV